MKWDLFVVNWKSICNRSLTELILYVLEYSAGTVIGICIIYMRDIGMMGIIEISNI